MNEEIEYPLVSAIMLAGKCSIGRILSAIECFNSQTYPYKELIIINNTKSQFEATELNIRAQRDIFVLDTPVYISAGMARNYGMSSANGQILAQFDANYYHHPERLETQVASLAREESYISVLSKTLQYSFISGRESYNENDIGMILGTMVFIRQKDVDYPNAEKGEEKEFFDKLLKMKCTPTILDRPDLACKIIDTKYNKITKISSSNITRNHSAIMQNLLQRYI